MGTTEKLRTAVQMRLQIASPLIAQWPQAMALGARPDNLPGTLRLLAELMDEMWMLSGDRSNDWNWYTKRALLGGVYTATELYMLTDKSYQFHNTWTFLDRRLQDALTVGQLPSQVLSVAGSVSGALSSKLATFFTHARPPPPPQH
jgi:ubiquinone biosynthesis protein COQ9